MVIITASRINETYYLFISHPFLSLLLFFKSIIKSVQRNLLIQWLIQKKNRIEMNWRPENNISPNYIDRDQLKWWTSIKILRCIQSTLPLKCINESIHRLWTYGACMAWLPIDTTTFTMDLPSWFFFFFFGSRPWTSLLDNWSESIN